MTTETEEGGFEYWVNVYPDFIDLGGRTRDQADLNHRERWQWSGGELPRVGCRLLRYVPGRGLKDVTPKRPRTWSAAALAAAAERMKAANRRRRDAKAHPRPDGRDGPASS